MTEESGPPAPEITARYDELQRRVTRFSVVEQQLIHVRDRLDRELGRFGRMHAFSTRALPIEGEGEFADTVAEAIVDIFEVELGVFWTVRDDGSLDPRSAACGAPEPSALDEAGRLLLARPGSTAAQLLDAAGSALCRLLHLRQAIVVCCRNSKRELTGLLLGGIADAAGSQFDPLSSELSESFGLFAQQVGALLENRRGRAIIAEQMRALQISQEQHRQARELAESASRSKSAFLANMSHEIRTPMNGVIGMLQLLSDLDPTPRQIEYIRNAEDAASSLLDILGDILDISKIEAGKFEIDRQPFALERTLWEVVALFSARAKAKGLELQVHAPTLPRVVGDAVRLRQVLNNLVGNALKFTERGCVDLYVDQRPDGFEVRVRDTGIGIPPDALERLFTAFMQADSSTTRRFGGTGLGLAISQNLVRLMGGELRVESEVGKGSTFSFVLPLPLAPTDSVVATSRTAASLPLLAGRVLVVEDNPLGQTVARSYLERLGLTVSVAGDGREALDLLEQERFALVLMDCQMPILDGFEATRAYRKREAERGLPRVPIIALTANALAEDERACLDAGMDSFLTKPIRRDVLVERLAQYLPK